MYIYIFFFLYPFLLVPYQSHKLLYIYIIYILYICIYINRYMYIYILFYILYIYIYIYIHIYIYIYNVYIRHYGKRTLYWLQQYLETGWKEDKMQSWPTLWKLCKSILFLINVSVKKCFGKWLLLVSKWISCCKSIGKFSFDSLNQSISILQPQLFLYDIKKISLK